MPDYDIDLTNWVPKYLLTTSSAHRGEAVEETDWNDRWNLLRDVSDYNTQTVANTLAALVLSVWHATNGAASIKHPALPYDTRAVVDQSLNVSGQLLWLDSQNKDRTDAIAALAAVVAAMPVTHAALPDLDGADAHPISAITGLQAALDGIVAGDMAAINHNLLGSRDAAGAHPLAAITGLSEWKTAYDLIAARNHNDWPNRNAAGAHTGAAITYDATNTVTQKIGALEAAIQGITGGIAEISHDNLTNRDIADQHPISAVTGLQAALDAKAAATLLANYQPKVLSGTTVPAAALGNNGDIYIRYV